MTTHTGPTPEQIAAAAPPLSPAVRERLRRALIPPAAPLPPPRSRAGIRVTARDAIARLATASSAMESSVGKPAPTPPTPRPKGAA